ncbi:PREDICTED: uncharacterized protein LOC106001530 [Dipodomys ordii]|uniref:Uncharacterized protein LOC106001530 n=1 Tax=Dipodomys ordii TaxID=10020 RepID=A0A1S3GVT3_DIPOR|nr:PREDICTED: uncharacterized protein LOC106001530 [Dipodomys ordii]
MVKQERTGKGEGEMKCGHSPLRSAAQMNLCGGMGDLGTGLLLSEFPVQPLVGGGQCNGSYWWMDFLSSCQEQYKIGQLYMISKHSHEQSDRGEGVEVVQNEPFEDPHHGNGQFTEKRVYLNSKLPSWARAVVPKIFYVTEKAWNYYPYTITEYTCSFLPKFSIHIETKYEDNKGSNDSNFDTEASFFFGLNAYSICNGKNVHGGLQLAIIGHLFLPTPTPSSPDLRLELKFPSSERVEDLAGCGLACRPRSKFHVGCPNGNALGITFVCLAQLKVVKPAKIVGPQNRKP